MNDSPVRILIAEWIPSLNKGELAILIGMLKTFEELGNVEISIFSLFPSFDKERYPKNVKLIDICSELYLTNPLLKNSKLIRFRNFVFATLQHLLFIFLYKTIGENVLKITNKTIWKEYCKSDVIIICHDQVDCVSGSDLEYSPVYITLLAKALHKPITIYANGTSNFNKMRKIFATYVLNNVDLITCRTEESFVYLEKFLWNKARIHFTGDPALLLPSANPKTKKAIMNEIKINNKTLLVGVALSQELLLNAFQMCKNPTTRYQKATTEIAKLFDNLTENHQMIIVFIPHCIEPYQQRDDRIVARKIYNLMKNKFKVRILDKEHSPEELKALMAELDIFISTRVHAAIGALSMGVPSIVITRSADRRAYGLIGQNLKQNKWIYDVENLDITSLFSHITDLLSASDDIRKDLESIVISAKEKALLNGTLLKTLIDSHQKK